jgi:hypothetical protein
MLSLEERRLIVGILALLLFGAAVDAWRSHVAVRDAPKTVLPATVPSVKGFTRE